ncbi:tetraacyldisaccharide 4'-kinase [Oceanobacter mangrovi]|uniref:tetraacyldisaccharide 4'-kinase n=1 Tax=Oceanobacter mangrovi TaxID=2862510 RepID=UPI001C8EB0C7|nr:tetraacyldisaccharide 4'-kinase [Oceanobacter mangrovi]
MSSESRRGLAALIERNWYRPALYNLWLLPLNWLFVVVAVLRRIYYAVFPPKAVSVPVVVVGNINVGGTGKTPLITWLVERAMQLNMRVGVVSRGYGGKSEQYPLEVTADTDVSLCGDEPRLLANRTGCTVVVDPQRRRAVEYLQGKVDIIFSDDGLQHYAMPRVAELVVVDGERRFGNGWTLPVGPLREPRARLQTVDAVLVNGEDFVLEPLSLRRGDTNEQADLLALEGKKVHAVAGIGHPARFFTTLRQLGMELIEHPFNDHHEFKPEDLDFGDGLPVVMTEKDWVKCRAFAAANSWYLPVGAVLTKSARHTLDKLLLTWGEKRNG